MDEYSNPIFCLDVDTCSYHKLVGSLAVPHINTGGALEIITIFDIPSSILDWPQRLKEELTWVLVYNIIDGLLTSMKNAVIQLRFFPEHSKKSFEQRGQLDITIQNESSLYEIHESYGRYQYFAEFIHTGHLKLMPFPFLPCLSLDSWLFDRLAWYFIVIQSMSPICGSVPRPVWPIRFIFSTNTHHDRITCREQYPNQKAKGQGHMDHCEAQ